MADPKNPNVNPDAERERIERERKERERRERERAGHPGEKKMPGEERDPNRINPGGSPNKDSPGQQR